MGLPKDLKKPAMNYTYTSEVDYQDTSLSTVTKLQVTDPAKSAGDYGVVDPKVTEPVAGTTSETGNGAKGV